LEPRFIKESNKNANLAYSGIKNKKNGSNWSHLGVCELDRILLNHLLADIDNVLKVLNDVEYRNELENL